MTETAPPYDIECKRLLYGCIRIDGAWVAQRDYQDFYRRVEGRAEGLGRDLQADLTALMASIEGEGR